MTPEQTAVESVGFIKICLKALALLSLSVTDESSMLEEDIGESFQANQGNDIATVTRWSDGSATFIALIDGWKLKGSLTLESQALEKVQP